MEIGISNTMSLIAEVKVGQMAVVKTGTPKYIPELIEEVDSVETDSETVEPPTSWNFTIEILKCLTSFISFDERRTL